MYHASSRIHRFGGNRGIGSHKWPRCIPACSNAGLLYFINGKKWSKPQSIIHFLLCNAINVDGVSQTQYCTAYTHTLQAANSYLYILSYMLTLVFVPRQYNKINKYSCLNNKIKKRPWSMIQLFSNFVEPMISRTFSNCHRLVQAQFIHTVHLISNACLAIPDIRQQKYGLTKSN